MKKIIMVFMALTLIMVSCGSNKTLKIYPREYTEEEREILSILDSGANAMVYNFEGNTEYTELTCSLVNYETEEVIFSNDYIIKESGTFALSLGLPGDDMMLSIHSDGSGRYEYYDQNFVNDYEVSTFTQIDETLISDDEEVLLALIAIREGDFKGVRSQNASVADRHLLLENLIQQDIYEEIYLLKIQFSK